MSKWKTSLLAAMLAAASIAQTSSGIMSPEVKSLGLRLACLCGACNNSVGDCLMLECGYCKPVREKMAALKAAGKDDQGIIDAIVADHGLQALVAPPHEGFNLVGWWMPAAVLVLGFMALVMFVRRFRRQPSSTANLDPRILDKYHEQIEKDMNKFDA